MLLEKATSFIKTMYTELNYDKSIIEKRLSEIENEINLTGSYTHLRRIVIWS